MLIDKDIDKFLVTLEDSIAYSLEKLNVTKLQILFVVDESRRLCGAFTDGDFRRWVLGQQHIDIDSPVAAAMNKKCQSYTEDTDSAAIEGHLNERIKFVPLTNPSGKILGIATRQALVFSIDDKTISQTSGTYIIAEVGNNHNGSLDAAKKLVDEAISAGADCVKFQMRDLDSLYVNKGCDDDTSEDLGSQYVLDLLRKYQLSDASFKTLFEYCRSRNITPLCTPFDIKSADKLLTLGVAAFKVASADLTNHPLLRHLTASGLPLFISTGMASESEIQESVAILKSEGAKFVLLHCNSTYPAPFKDINLNYMARLSELNQGLIGYSGHERGIHIAVAAVALGAKVIEKHFTLDRKQQGNDHKVSLLPNEFRSMVQAIRQVELSLGENSARKLSQGEMMNRETLGKSIVATKDIVKGQRISRDMLQIRSPGKGLPPYYLDQLLQTNANRDININDFFYISDLSTQQHTIAANYRFSQPFGIPVRYHDLELIERSNFSLLEFHFSYKDLLIDPADFVTPNNKLKCVVHAPELFENDHLLDLANDCCEYRELSIQNLNRVFDLARKLRKFYPNTKNVPVVVNVGGFSQSDFLTEAEKHAKYLLLEQSIKELNCTNIQILIQTMPPFPWHFGGQSFHNLFVNAHETRRFCERNNLNVCLDVSHSWLACNQFDWKISDYFTLLGPFIKHLHIADGAGVDDEGLQIGEGDLDMRLVFELMTENCPTASWIPEVWQGHKNYGEGFWIALEKLEKIAELKLE
jgi:N-acetylneuraminate synthase